MHVGKIALVNSNNNNSDMNIGATHKLVTGFVKMYFVLTEKHSAVNV
jgi:hypothetical protein